MCSRLRHLRVAAARILRALASRRRHRRRNVAASEQANKRRRAAWRPANARRAPVSRSTFFKLLCTLHFDGARARLLLGRSDGGDFKHDAQRKRAAVGSRPSECWFFRLCCAPSFMLLSQFSRAMEFEAPVCSKTFSRLLFAVSLAFFRWLEFGPTTARSPKLRYVGRRLGRREARSSRRCRRRLSALQLYNTRLSSFPDFPSSDPLENVRAEDFRRLLVCDN